VTRIRDAVMKTSSRTRKETKLCMPEASKM